MKKWTQQQILELGGSFREACILTAAADLDIFSALVDKPMTASAVASKLGAEPRATTILLDALTAMELLTKEQDCYGLGENISQLLTGQSTCNVLPMLRHQYNCLRRWAQLSDVVRAGKPCDTIFSPCNNEANMAAFIGAMHVVSAPMADEVVGRLTSLSFTHLLDIGGASGTWTITLLRKNPQARATLFDLPGVIPMAEERIADAGLSDRVALAAGDFYADDLPGGADLAWLGAICHQNSRQQNRDLFSKAHKALVDGGSVVIRDVVMDSSHTSPPYGALFAVNMLVATEAGGTYTFDEYSEDLQQAGFRDVTLAHRDPGMNSIITATKAST